MRVDGCGDCGFFSLCMQLSKKVVNLKEVRRLASQGIPDGAGIRSTVWKVILMDIFLDPIL